MGRRCCWCCRRHCRRGSPWSPAGRRFARASDRTGHARAGQEPRAMAARADCAAPHPPALSRGCPSTLAVADRLHRRVVRPGGSGRLLDGRRRRPRGRALGGLGGSSRCSLRCIAGSPRHRVARSRPLQRDRRLRRAHAESPHRDIPPGPHDGGAHGPGTAPPTQKAARGGFRWRTHDWLRTIH